MPIEIDFEYKSPKGVTVKGPRAIAFNTIKDFTEFIVASHIDLAREFRKTQEVKLGFPKDSKDYVTIVDGKVGASDLSVKPFGKTTFSTKLDSIEEVILEAMKRVVAASYQSTGYYTSMHVLLYNGQVVAKGQFETNAWFKRRANATFKDGDNFRIINFAPYARKNENLGKKKGTRGKLKGVGIKSNRRRVKSKSLGFKLDKPNGTYWTVKNSLRRDFVSLRKNIRFSYIPVASNIPLSLNTRALSKDYLFKKGKGKGRPYLYPNISITVGENVFTTTAGFTEGGGKL